MRDPDSSDFVAHPYHVGGKKGKRPFDLAAAGVEYRQWLVRINNVPYRIQQIFCTHLSSFIYLFPYGPSVKIPSRGPEARLLISLLATLIMLHLSLPQHPKRAEL